MPKIEINLQFAIDTAECLCYIVRGKNCERNFYLHQAANKMLGAFRQAPSTKNLS